MSTCESSRTGLGNSASDTVERWPMSSALGHRWREPAIEGALLGAFMLSASAFTTLLEHPSSPLRSAIAPTMRRMLLGIAMGLTAIVIVYSPWGRRSGAHINPAVTLAMLRLGRIAREDAAWYVPAQLAGAVAGMLLASAVLGPLLAAPAVHYVVTRPGMQGILAAFAAEALISSLLLTCVLESNASSRLGRYTGLVAGALVATFIVCEAPLSGMSMNPARSFGSAVAALDWTSLWVYFAAPPLGMLGAAQLFLWRRGSAKGVCAKLRPHRAGEPCQLCASVDVPASLTSNAGTIHGLL